MGLFNQVGNWKISDWWSLIFALHVHAFYASIDSIHDDELMVGLFKLRYMYGIGNLTRFQFYLTYFLSLFPAPVSRNPLAKGLLSIFNCVICREKSYF